MDKISGMPKGNKYIPFKKVQKIANKEKENPDEMVLEYVCSKGDREYHTVAESFVAVREHELNHIREYHEMAQKLGLRVVNPHIEVYTEYFPEIKKQVAVGGKATCQFVATIDGEEVIVPVSKDGYILDSEIVKKLEKEKMKRMGLLKNKKKTKDKKIASEKEGYILFDPKEKDKKHNTPKE